MSREPVANLVRKARGIPNGPKSVLYALATYANPDGSSVYPSIETLTEDSGFAHRSSTLRHLRWLRANGFLIVIEEGRVTGKPTHYQISLSALGGCVSRDTPGVSVETQGCVSGDTGGVSVETHNYSGTTHDQSRTNHLPHAFGGGVVQKPQRTTSSMSKNEINREIARLRLARNWGRISESEMNEKVSMLQSMSSLEGEQVGTH